MRAKVVLAALSVSTFLYVTTETLPIGLLPQIAAGLGVTTSSAGLLVTAYGLVVVVATMPLTRLTQRWPRRRLLTTLLLVATVATTWSALAPNYPALLAGRVTAALSQAVFWAVVTPAAASLFRAEVRGRAISFVYVGSSAATLLGVPAGTWLGQQYGWRLPFLLLATLGLAVSAAIASLMPDVAPGTSDADRGTAPSRGRYRVLVATVAVTVTGAFIAFTCISPFLTAVTGVPSAAVGPILLVRGVAGLSGAIIAGYLPARRSRPAMAALIAALTFGLAVQGVAAGSPALTVVAVAIAGFAMSAMTTVLATRILQVAPASTDMASAGVSTAFNVGITAGSLGGSLLLAADALRWSALLGAVIAAAGLAIARSESRLVTRRSASQPRPGGGGASPVRQHRLAAPARRA